MAKVLNLGALRPEPVETAGAKKTPLLPTAAPKPARKATARTISVSALLAKKYDYIEGLPEHISASFGKLPYNFIAIIWGHSGNGKSSFLLQVIEALLPFGKALYVSLEEGTEASMQQSVIRQIDPKLAAGKLEFADHHMTHEQLMVKLAKRKSAQFIIIDSVQYWGITVDHYKELKQRFPKKAFIFISHAKGKLPDGKTADKIRYDAGIKIRVEKYVAFFETSRYGGMAPFIIWADGAKKHYGADLKNILAGKPPAKAAKPRKSPSKPKPTKTEDENN